MQILGEEIAFLSKTSSVSSLENRQNRQGKVANTTTRKVSLKEKNQLSIVISISSS